MSLIFASRRRGTGPRPAARNACSARLPAALSPVAASTFPPHVCPLDPCYLRRGACSIRKWGCGRSKVLEAPPSDCVIISSDINVPLHVPSSPQLRSSHISSACVQLVRACSVRSTNGIVEGQRRRSQYRVHNVLRVRTQQHRQHPFHGYLTIIPCLAGARCPASVPFSLSVLRTGCPSATRCVHATLRQGGVAAARRRRPAVYITRAAGVQSLLHASRHSTPPQSTLDPLGGVVG